METSSYKSSTTQDTNLDFGSILKKYSRHWVLFLTSLLVCLTLAGLYLYRTPKSYLVMSNVLIEDEKSGGTSGSAAILKNLTGGLGGSKVDNEVIIINSHENRHDVAKELKLNIAYFERKNILKKVNLYKTSPVEISGPEELFDTLRASLQFKINLHPNGSADIKVSKGFFSTPYNRDNVSLPATVKTKYGTFIVSKTKYFDSSKPHKIIAYVSNLHTYAEKMLKDMYVKLVSKKANVIYLRIADTNTERGKEILNTLERIYNDRNQQDKNENALTTGKFIDERLAKIYQDLSQSEYNIEEFKRRNNIVDVGQQAKAIITKQEAADQRAIALETRYRIVEMINDFISKPENKYAYIPFTTDSTSATGPIAAFNGLIMKRMKLEASALPDNQALKDLDAQIDQMRANVQHGVNNTLSALQVQINKARAVSNSSLGQMSNMPAQERQSLDLYREQGIQNALYTFLLQKREENVLALAASSPKGKVVDRPFAQTTPDKPKTGFVLGIAFLLGLIIPMLLLYFKDMLRTKFDTQAELSALTNAPLLGEIGHNKNGENLVVLSGKTTPIAEQFRLIRNNVQFMMPSASDKVILVTSSVSGEGKSFVSLNTAASFALLGKRVALVGMDIRNPKLSEMLALKSSPGVTSYLSQTNVSVSDIVQSVPAVSGLDVLVGGVIPPNPSELLVSDRTTELLSELKRAYDIIVIDSAPTTLVSDTFALTKHANLIIFVTKANFTNRNLIGEFNLSRERGQLPNSALVLNDVKDKSDAAKYGYGSFSEE